MGDKLGRDRKELKVPFINYHDLNDLKLLRFKIAVVKMTTVGVNWTGPWSRVDKLGRDRKELKVPFINYHDLNDLKLLRFKIAVVLKMTIL